MKIKDIEWQVETYCDDGSILYSYYLDGKDISHRRITVLDRLTGFGYRDIEIGYQDELLKFWLASGDFDIREYPELTISEAIDLIKQHFNSCKGC